MGKKRKPAATRKARAQKPRRKSRPEQHRHGGHAPRPIAVDVLARHERGFVAWAERTELHGPDTDGHDIFRGACLLLELTAGRTGLTDPTRMTELQVEALMDAVIDDGSPMEDVRPTLDSLSHVLEYLDDADLWRGTDEDLEGSLKLLTEITAPSVPEALIGVLEAVTVDPAAQDRALADLPLLQHAEALLDWVDEGPRSARQVTATGAVRRADLLAAAAAVGVALPQGPDGVRTMRDVIGLDRLWRTCQAVTLLQTSRTLVRRGDLGQIWRDGSTKERSDARAVLVVDYLLNVLVEDSGPPPWVQVHGTATAGALLTLVASGPSSREALAHENEVLGAVGWLELVRLAQVGVVRIDGDTATVVPGLERLVAVTLRLYLEEVVGSDVGPPRGA